MATALVVANLLWLLARRRLSSALFASGWLYCLVLNRRADVLAMAVLGAIYLLFLMQGPWRCKAAMALAWVAFSGAGLLWQQYDGTRTRDPPTITPHEGDWDIVASNISGGRRVGKQGVRTCDERGG